jgi:hypothetical protein
MINDLTVVAYKIDAENIQHTIKVKASRFT